MKTHKIIYWTSTSLISLMMLFSAFMYLSQSPELMGNFLKIGIPLYLVMLLGIAKLLGAIALIVPKWPAVKEWAYAGFAFTFIGAVWVHIATGTPFVAPVVALLLLATSYYSKLQLGKKQEIAQAAPVTT